MSTRNRMSIFNKFFISYVLIGIFPTVILGSVFYYYNVVNYKENIREANFNKLIQVKNHVDLNLKVLSDVTYHISSNEQILDASIMNAKNHNGMEVISQLQTYMESCLFLDDILFYYRGTKDIYLTDGCYYYYDFENNVKKGMKWWKSTFFIDINTAIAPKISKINTDDKAEDINGGILALIYPIPYLNTMPSSTVVYMMKEDYILSKFDDYFEDFKGCIFVFDDYYRTLILANRGIPDIDKDMLEKQCSQYKGIGIWNIHVNNRAYVAMRTVSENNGWSYVIIMTHRQYFEGVNEMRFKVLNIIFILIGIGLILAFALSKSNYEPIKALVGYVRNQDYIHDDYGSGNELEAIRYIFEKSYIKSRELIVQVNAQRPFVRDQCLIKILDGKVKDSYELNYLLKCANIELEGATYFTMVLSTRMRGMQDISIEELLKLLENIIFVGSIGSKGYGVELVQEKVIAIVVSMEKHIDSCKAEQNAIAEDVSSLIERSFSVKPAIGVGDVYTDILQLKNSFLEALSALYENRTNYSTNIFFFNDQKDMQHQIDWYPIMQQSLYIESLKQGNKAVALDALRSMLNTIDRETSSYFMIKCQCFDILNNVIKSINKMDMGDCAYNIKRITMFNTLDEFRDEMERFSAEFCDYMDKLKEKRSNELKNNIIKYVNDNFTSNNISLDDIASKFDVSSTYVSRFFKDETGLNFIDYITSLRMDYVKKQLKDTEKPIKDIALEAGYIDASSFSRKFKTMEGVTPVQYRRIIKQIR